MPLQILLTLVIGGIAAIAMLLHMLGKSALLALDTNSAKEAWLRHFPDDTVQDLLVAGDGHAALVLTDRGPGLLWSFGADTVARHLRDFTYLDGDTRQTIRFSDYGAPRVCLRLTATERQRWQTLMRGT
ncbi:hypothetical protein [Sedimentitalea todarodis]|uniref:Uncharacterized protein n=1 Tax=Sedimentitalea todarodis TaxID=1631240 RepID=A0ABU3VJD2_9RHOB|nr:hypothetical protein [Sedimentitalea todarodis]MDU9005819.1 hypothetical protein [Sedimentitalea todarodis]